MATLEEYANWIVRNKDKAGTPEFNRVAQAYQLVRANEQSGITGNEGQNDRAVRAAAQLEADRKTYDPTKGMSNYDLAAAGAGKAISDTGLGVGQVLRARDRADVTEGRKLDAPLMATGAGMAGNIGGNVGMALLPGGAAMAAGKTVGALTKAQELAKILSSTGKAIIAPPSIPAALGVGATQGVLQPSASMTETLANTGLGMAGGAAVPAGVRAAQVGKAAIEPFSAVGQNKIIGRALNEATGGDAQAVMQRLNAAAPLVPNSFPTAGQSGGNPGLAALERTATATDPVAMNQIAQRLKDQNAARVAALQGAAPDRASAMAARTAATEPLYRQAYGESISMTPGLSSLMERPSMQGAMNRGQALAREQGQQLSMTSAKPGGMSSSVGPDGVPTLTATPPAPATMTGRDAHLMKMGLDDMANASPMSGIGGNELRAIQGTRGDFLSEIEKQVPSYGQARQTYADMSRPINQADVVEEIGKSINHRGDITPAAYARALRDETAQKVTGQANSSLAKVFIRLACKPA